MLAAAGLMACHSDAPTTASDDLGPIAATATTGDCVSFQGNQHCPLGAAKLTPSADGASLQATGLTTAGKDGVSILLPDVTQFTPTGQIDSKSGMTLIARSINEGVSTSSLNVKRSLDGFAISASFTGSAAGSTYSARLYNSGQLVGTIGGLPSGGNGMITWRPCAFPPPGCRWPAPPPWPPWPPFLVVQNPTGGGGPTVGAPGACVWKLNFGKDNPIQTKLADGSSVIADAVDLVEDVQGQGSYPYLTFNRIDYTTDALDGRIDSEAIK